MAEDESALLLRIFLGEDDYHDDVCLYEKIVYEANKAGLAGATITKGVMGFGANSVIRKSKMVMSADLPVVIEIVDEEDKIMDFMDHVHELFKKASRGGLIIYEEVNVKFYGVSES